MALAPFSEKNLANSLSLELAERLLAEGYLVYWHPIDAVQTPDAWYYDYSTNQATYLADATFAARRDDARGLITLKGKTSSIPEYPVRPTSDGTVTSQEDVPVPYLAVEVGAMSPGRLIELGSRMRERYRHLAIYGAARDVEEQTWLRDKLGEWFDESTFFEIRDHDAGTLDVVGTVETTMVMTDSATLSLGADALTFELILNARLQYEA